MAAPVARPIIGINTDLLINSKTQAITARIPSGYFDSIVKAGALPIIIPPLPKEADLDALLDRVDGMVLVGGLDLDPRRQGQPTHAAVVPMAERREAFDAHLVQRIVDRQIPVLGIGVGMQQLNLAFGGSLYLHLPEEQPRAMPHYDPSGGPHRHIVNIEPGSRLDEVYGGGELRVNSMHHQAVKTLGKNLRVGATSPDGIIEAIEYTGDDWFCVGVQWHPEHDTASALDMQIFECFLKACMPQRPVLQLVA
jgi:putative glutamine amidotransferase